MSEIVVVDYHKGNLSSVARSIDDVHGDVIVSDDPTIISEAKGIVLPGVGSFEDAMSYLRASRQADAIVNSLKRGVPFLGICLGLHVLFQRGSERSGGSSWGGEWVPGLGILDGSVTRLDSDGVGLSSLKVPHVGWDQMHLTDRGRVCPLLADVAEGANVYYTHSYAVDGASVSDDIVIARSHYCRSYPSAVWSDNVYGVQFHPEKSSSIGLRILRNFVDIVRG